MKDKTVTNVIRLLKAVGIAHEVHCYDPSTVDGEAVAACLGEDKARVYKSLVTVDDKGRHAMFEVRVDRELDLKKAARALGAKWVKLIPQRELLPLTGYVHGGCSPIGLKKRMPCYLDESSLFHESIFVSAGQRGLQVELSPISLRDYLHATTGDYSKEKSVF